MGNHASKPKEGCLNTTIRCYYEILGVVQTASDDEIRKAYRQKALQLHPDRNIDRIKEATVEFAAIQHAYQVLSDPQERSWYDRHRSKILGNHSMSEEDVPGLDDLLVYFSASCFSGFGDDPKGFFSIYRELFRIIEDYESEAAFFDQTGHRTGRDTSEHVAVTSFGSKNTPFEPSLSEFYDKWLNFMSSRTFDFADKYQEQFNDNRRVRRAMAKENHRLREKQRKEFSETVRSLAKYIQRRDPRYLKWKEDCKKKRETLRQAKKASEAESQNTYVSPLWSDYNVDAEVLLSMLEKVDIGSDTSSQKADEEFSELRCLACKKTFKNLKQWQNHEQSKKHRQKMVSLGFEPDEFMRPPVHNVVDILDHLDDVECMDKDVIVEPDVVEPTVFPDTHSSEPHHASEEKKVSSTHPKRKRRSEKKNVNPAENQCKVCHETFASRNQLFRHIESEGHAALRK